MLTWESYGAKVCNGNALDDGDSPSFVEALSISISKEVGCFAFQLQEPRNDEKFGEWIQEETRTSAVNASAKKRAKNWEEQVEEAFILIKVLLSWLIILLWIQCDEVGVQERIKMGVYVCVCDAFLGYQIFFTAWYQK